MSASTEMPSSAELANYLRLNAIGAMPNPFAKEVEAAPKSLKSTYTIAYVQHAPLEPRTAVAEWADGKLTVWTATQNPFRVRDELAEAFRVPAADVRVIIPDFGSGYGGKHTGECAVEAARIAMELDEDLGDVVKRPLDAAKKVLRKFPGVGEPGAEKLAMIYGGHRVLALESNGLRVLLRLGYGAASKDYGKTYRSVTTALAPEVGRVRDLPRAHELLRMHGQRLCKANRPSCPPCPLRDVCPSAVG